MVDLFTPYFCADVKDALMYFDSVYINEHIQLKDEADIMFVTWLIMIFSIPVRVPVSVRVPLTAYE